MKKCFFIACFLICLSQLYAQKKDTLKLFYEIDSDEPDVSKLDSFIISLHGLISELQIIGYADYLSSDFYNMGLSQRRANKVKKYLLSKSKQFEILECKGKGELKSALQNKDGVAYHRRVDVVFRPKIISQEIDAFPVSEPKKSKKDTITNDKKKTIADLSVGESMSIEGLSFIPGEHYLIRESAVPLRRLLETLQKNPKLKIEIQGHVCCTDNNEDGIDLSTGEKKLSENRAKYIYNYLIGKGIDADRLTYKGYGRTMPKAPLERNEVEQQMNRRVEIKVLEK